MVLRLNISKRNKIMKIFEFIYFSGKNFFEINFIYFEKKFIYFEINSKNLRNMKKQNNRTVDILLFSLSKQ